MENKDYYRVLGVDKDASADAIKRAYRKLIRKFHPDLSKAANADLRAKQLNEAYAVLGDAQKRAEYDERSNLNWADEPYTAPSPSRAHAGSGAASGAARSAQDFFSDLFAHGERRPAFRARGEDIHAKLTLTLRELYRGAQRSLTLHLPGVDARGRASVQARTVSVNVPKGIMPGQQLRLAGQGQAGKAGAPPGDLYMDIEIAPDAHYRLDGRNVFATIPVAPWEAALGAQIEAPTPDGAVSVGVPAGSQGGRKLRLRGRGIPGTPPGDLYIVLDIVLPPAAGPKARALYEAMAREMAFNPRRHLQT